MSIITILIQRGVSVSKILDSTPTAADWKRVETQLFPWSKVKLPLDYKKVVSEIGTRTLGNGFILLNPVCQDPELALSVSNLQKLFAQYALRLNVAAVHPCDGGIIAIAKTKGNTRLVLVSTDLNYSSWKTGVVDLNHNKIEVYPKFRQFLTDLFSNSATKLGPLAMQLAKRSGFS